MKRKLISPILILMLFTIAFTGCVSQDDSKINHYKYDDFLKGQGDINSPISLNVSCRRAILIQLNDNSYSLAYNNYENEIYILFSQNLLTWNQSNELFVVEGYLVSLLQKKDGSFLIGFYLNMDYGSEQGEYVINSENGIHWKDPIKVVNLDKGEPDITLDQDDAFIFISSSGTQKSLDGENWEKISDYGFEYPSIIQKKNGEYVIAGNTETKEGNNYDMVSTSNDAKDWKELDGNFDFDMGPGELIENNLGQLIFSHARNSLSGDILAYHGTYIIISEDGKKWSYPIQVVDPEDEIELYGDYLIQNNKEMYILLLNGPENLYIIQFENEDITIEYP